MNSEAMQVRDPSPLYGAEPQVQDVRPRCKQTAVGMIPCDWGLAPCDVLCLKIQDGTHFSPKPGGADRLYVTSRNIGRGTLDVSDAEYISEVEHRKIYSRCDTRQGDLLLTKDGANTGNAAINTIGEEISLLSSVVFLRFNPRRGIAEFFLQWILSSDGQSQIKNLMSGNAITRLTLAKIKKFSVPVPPLPEQRAIAEALSDIDGLLEALEALIAKKRAIKQAAMQQLLTGKTRLPGFSGEWETKRLGDMAEIHSGATPSTQIPENWDGDIPWCTPTDITGTLGKYLTSTERRITRQGLASCAANLLPRGALLLCSRATVGELKIATTPICTNQGFKSLVCKRGTSNEYLYYLLLTLKPALIERSSGSTFLEIGKRDVASLQALFPTEGEQTAIATVLSDMDAEITALEARRDKTRQIKQGMMQQLLTGRVRLVRPETPPAC